MNLHNPTYSTVHHYDYLLPIIPITRINLVIIVSHKPKINRLHYQATSLHYHALLVTSRKEYGTSRFTGHKPEGTWNLTLYRSQAKRNAEPLLSATLCRLKYGGKRTLKQHPNPSIPQVIPHYDLWAKPTYRSLFPLHISLITHPPYD